MARLVLALLAALAAAPPAAAQWQTVDTFTIKGAPGVIIIPEGWNGSLFIYAHGYAVDERLYGPFPDDLSPANFLQRLNILYQAVAIPTFMGYASATTRLRAVGWNVKEAIKDIENVRRRFARKYGKPRHTYLWGHSAGGLITSTVIELAPRTYDGALPMCHPGAGARRNLNAAFDLRALYEWVCRDAPGAQFVCRLCSDGQSRCLVDADCPAGQSCGGAEAAAPYEDGLTRECTEFLIANPQHFAENPRDPAGAFTVDPVTACFGDVVGDAPPSPEQQARRDLFLRAAQIPQSFILTDLFFATIGLGEIVHRRTGGRHPWGNMGVRYEPLLLTPAEIDALNAGIPRAREDARGTRYLRRFYEPRGRTKAKVLTVHALDDGLVVPENQSKYRQAFEAAGTADRLVQLFTDSGGHCGFILELFPALEALTAWVEQDVKPSTAAVQTACPTCAFVDAAPGPWGQRIVEREQRGVPLRSLVCTGEPGDCPPGTTCDLARQHCRR